MGPVELLREAQKLHYGKQFDAAVEVYERIIGEFPDSKQARTARQQIQNLRPVQKPRPAASTSPAPDKVQKTRSAPSSIVFPCPACQSSVRVAIPLKGPSFRCGACKQELRAETPTTDPWVVVVSAKILTETAVSLEKYRPEFGVLGLEPTSDMTEIRRAWRVQLTQYHPDRVASLGPDLRFLAEEKTKRINAAFDALEKALSRQAT